MSIDSQIYWPDEPRRVFEAARLELARMQVGGESSLHEVAQRITELAARTLRVERVGIWVLMNERSLLRASPSAPSCAIPCSSSGPPVG